MRTSTILLLSCAALAGGCKKKGGGGGSWLVGQNGLMANVRADNTLGDGYQPGVGGDLRGITCLDDATAFVVGDGGVFLRTFDSGRTWERRDLGTTEALRTVDAAWPGTIDVAGADGLYRSEDLGATWTRIATGAWRGIALDDDGATAIALDDDGGVWRQDGDGALAPVTDLAGARGVSVSHDGHVAAVTGGRAILRSTDGGATWARFDADADLNAAWASDDETVMAVGAAGAMVAVAPDGAVRVAGFGGPDLRALYLEDTVGYAVGDAGAVYRMDGGAWTRLDLGLTDTILAVEDLDGGW